MYKVHNKFITVFVYENTEIKYTSICLAVNNLKYFADRAIHLCLLHNVKNCCG